MIILRNQKGFTIMETLVSFILVMIILMNMFSIMMTYREKSTTEMLREDYLTLKAVVTKDIQNDILKKELVDIKQMLPANQCGADVVSCIELSFKDNTTKRLFVYNKQTVDQVRNKYIQYGDQKYRIRDDIPDASQIPAGRTVLDYQTVNVYSGRLFEKREVAGYTIYGIHITITYKDFDDDFGIHIIAIPGYMNSLYSE